MKPGRLAGLMGLLMLLGCGGADDPWLPQGDSGTPPEPQGPVPFIAQLIYQPTTAAQGEGGGVVPVFGTFEFVDEDGDVCTVRTCVAPCGQGTEVCEESPVFSVSGSQSGTLNFSFAAVTDCPAGTYSGALMVLDAQGHQSNVLLPSLTVR